MTQQGGPLVSVIISCYNHEKYIAETLESVLAQSWPWVELIVIDDGSQDDSATVIDAYAKAHGFVFVARENKGLAATLNEMIALAKGKYICSFGSDDVMLPDRIETQVRYMEAHPEVAVTGGNVINIDMAGRELARQKHYPLRTLDFDDIFFGRKPGIPAPTAMVRADVLRATGGYLPEIKLEDLYMWLKITSMGHVIVGLPDVLARYRKHAENNYRNLRYMMDNILRTYAQFSDHPDYPRVRATYLSKLLLNAAKSDPALGWEIVRMIPLRFWSMRTVRGFLRLLLKPGRR